MRDDEVTTSSSKKPGGMFIRLVGTTLTLILLIILLRQQGWQEIAKALQEIPIWIFALSFFLMMISRIAVAGRWHVLLQAVSPQLDFSQSLKLTFAGLFASNFLPTTIGGDVVRLAGAIQLQIDPAISTASLVVDRLVGMAGMLTVVPLGLPNFLSANLSGTKYNEITLIKVMGMAGWSKKIWDAFLKMSQRFLDAISVWRSNPSVLIKSLLISWIHMLFFFGVQWLFLSALGESISYWTVAGLYSLVYFIILLPFSINGYGLQEVSITFVFSSFGGVSIQNSLTLALLFRTIVMAASLPGALFVPGLVKNYKQEA